MNSQEKNATIHTSTLRISNALHMCIANEAFKSGNSINSEIISLINEGFRFRKANIVVQITPK